MYGPQLNSTFFGILVHFHCLEFKHEYKKGSILIEFNIQIAKHNQIALNSPLLINCNPREYISIFKTRFFGQETTLKTR